MFCVTLYIVSFSFCLNADKLKTANLKNEATLYPSTHMLPHYDNNNDKQQA